MWRAESTQKNLQISSISKSRSKRFYSRVSVETRLRGANFLLQLAVQWTMQNRKNQGVRLSFEAASNRLQCNGSADMAINGEKSLLSHDSPAEAC